jgi:hypothetical protein
MPRSEARIFASIWDDPDFLALPPGPQRLYMFLLSQKDLTYCGVLPLRPARWARKAIGLTAGEIEQDLKWLEGTPYPSANPDPGLARTPFVLIDEGTGELLVRSLLRRDGIWKQPNLLKQARESADSVESRRILGALLAELRRLPLEESGSDLVKTLVADFITDLDQGNPYPSAYPPDNGGADPSGDPTAKDNARAGGTGEGYCGNHEDSPIPLFPDPPTSLPAQRDRKQGTRMPDPFPVGAEMVAWVRKNCPHVDGKRETERFEDHWRGKAGKDGRKIDWVATWRNWMRNAEDRQGPRDRPGQTPRPSTTDQRVADAQALKAQFRDDPADPDPPPNTIPGSVIR